MIRGSYDRGATLVEALVALALLGLSASIFLRGMSRVARSVDRAELSHHAVLLLSQLTTVDVSEGSEPSVAGPGRLVVDGSTRPWPSVRYLPGSGRAGGVPADHDRSTVWGREWAWDLTGRGAPSGP